MSKIQFEQQIIRPHKLEKITGRLSTGHFTCYHCVDLSQRLPRKKCL